MVGILQWIGISKNEEENPLIVQARSTEAYQIPTKVCSTQDQNGKEKQKCETHFKLAQDAMWAGNLIKLEMQLKAFSFDEQLVDKLRLETAKQRLFKDPEGWISEIRNAQKDCTAWLVDIKTLDILAGYLQGSSDVDGQVKLNFYKVSHWTYQGLIASVLFETQTFIEKGEIANQKEVTNNLKWIQTTLEEAEKNGVLQKNDQEALLNNAQLFKVLAEFSSATHRNVCVMYLLTAWEDLQKLSAATSGVGLKHKNQGIKAKAELNKVAGQISLMGEDLEETIYENKDGHKLTRFLQNELEDKIVKAKQAINREDYPAAASLVDELLYQIYRRYPQSEAFNSDLGKNWLDSNASF